MLWSNNLRDTDKGLLQLYQACADVGPLACPIYESTAEKVKARVDALLEKLRTHPVAFYNETTGAYGEVDYSIAKGAIFGVLYNPHTSGRNLTVALADLENGIAEPIYQFARRKPDDDDLLCECPTVPPVPFAQGSHITLAVACGDGPPLNTTVDELRAFYDDMAKNSTFAEGWWIHLGCSYAQTFLPPPYQMTHYRL